MMLLTFIARWFIGLKPKYRKWLLIFYFEEERKSQNYKFIIQEIFRYGFFIKFATLFLDTILRWLNLVKAIISGSGPLFLVREGRLKITLFFYRLKHFFCDLEHSFIKLLHCGSIGLRLKYQKGAPYFLWVKDLKIIFINLKIIFIFCMVFLKKCNMVSYCHWKVI